MFTTHFDFLSLKKEIIVVWNDMWHEFYFFGWTNLWSWSLKNVKSSAPHLRPQDPRLYFYSYQFNCHACLLPRELPCNFPRTDLSLCYSVKACHHQSRPREWLACRGPQPWLRGGGLSSSAYCMWHCELKFNTCAFVRLSQSPSVWFWCCMALNESLVSSSKQETNGRVCLCIFLFLAED